MPSGGIQALGGTVQPESSYSGVQNSQIDLVTKRVHFKLSRIVTRIDNPGRGMPFRDTDLRQFDMHLHQNQGGLRKIPKRVRTRWPKSGKSRRNMLQ